MAHPLLFNYDLSDGDTIADFDSMLTSEGQVLTFQGVGLDADDATLAWEFSLDKLNWYPIRDNDDMDVVVTLVTTATNVEGYLNHEHFPGPFTRAVLTVNSVTAGTFNIQMGGRVRVNR